MNEAETQLHLKMDAPLKANIQDFAKIQKSQEIFGDKNLEEETRDHQMTLASLSAAEHMLNKTMAAPTQEMVAEYENLVTE